MPLPGASSGPRFSPSGAESKPKDPVTESPRPRTDTESASPPSRPTPSPRPVSTSAPESASPSGPVTDPLAEYTTGPMTEPPRREDGTPFEIERYKRPGASPLDMLPENVREQIEVAAETAEEAAKAAYELAKRNKRKAAVAGVGLIALGVYLAVRRR
jgi:hypothetical protein